MSGSFYELIHAGLACISRAQHDRMLSCSSYVGEQELENPTKDNVTGWTGHLRYQACIQMQDGMRMQIYNDEFILPKPLTSTISVEVRWAGVK